MKLLIDLHSDMTPGERIEAIARISMPDKQHLKRWLQGTGRQWLVFNAFDLVDALPWPAGVDLFMQLIACYRDHRAAIETGRHETQLDPKTKQEVPVALCKGETLEVEELDRTIRMLIQQILEKDPRWNLENQPL